MFAIQVHSVPMLDISVTMQSAVQHKQAYPSAVMHAHARKQCTHFTNPLLAHAPLTAAKPNICSCMGWLIKLHASPVCRQKSYLLAALLHRRKEELLQQRILCQPLGIRIVASIICQACL